MRRARLFVLLGTALSVAACPSPEEAPRTAADLPEATTPGAATVTPTPEAVRVPLVPVGASGTHGEASLREVGERTSVQLTLRDAPADATIHAHIHSGSCQAQGPVVAPLDPVITDSEGLGTSVTTIDLPIRTVTGGGHYVQAHTPGEAPGPPISCGDIDAATG
jgi:hypothetical protein